MYPTALTDRDGQTLDGSHAYRLTFAPGRLPPARAFWSLTLYDGDGYLVPNAVGRYAIGSSHPGLVRRADGSIVVVFQRDKPTEAGVNWLPTPAGAFRLNLRLYWPRQSALERGVEAPGHRSGGLGAPGGAAGPRHRRRGRASYPAPPPPE